MKPSRKRPQKRAALRTVPVKETPSSNPTLVAIGASAGGLEVFQRFFSLMPAESGLAFVLIQHLEPNHETLIPELLAKYTSMPVQQVVEAIAVEPNHIYVIPANG